MHIDPNELRRFEIFSPGLIQKRMAIESGKKRFVYYTDASTAIKLINNSELWLRNALVMNDHSEIYYGIELIRTALNGDNGKNFRDSVDSIFGGTIDMLLKLIDDWIRDWEYETYISCVSVHDDSEDKSGRLSMWRAYGDTALVINNTPIVAIDDRLGVFSVPVIYQTIDEYAENLKRITNNIIKNRSFLEENGQKSLVDGIWFGFFITAISSKHPGFIEEDEWRIFFRPNEYKSPAMKMRIEVLGGVPQIVYALQLSHDPDNGLHGADVPSLLDRVIIGPTDNAYVTQKAFQEVLRKAGVENVDDKVIVSDIPLRTK